MSERILKAVEFIAQTAFAAPAMTEAELGAAMARIARQCDGITAALKAAPAGPEDMAVYKAISERYFSDAALAAPTQGASSLLPVRELLSSLDRQHGNCMIGHDKSRSNPSPYTEGIVKGFGEALRIVKMWADSLPESPAAEAPTREDGEAEAESNDPRDAVLGEALLTSVVGDTASPLPAHQEPAEPLGEVVGTHKVGFAELATVAWAKGMPPVGTKLYAAPAPQEPAARVVCWKPMTDAQLEAGWEETFSTKNPFCPCDLRTFMKAARWAEWKTSHAMTALYAAPAPVDEPREQGSSGSLSSQGAEAGMQDAARYRWLRKHYFRVEAPGFDVVGADFFGARDGVALDSEIDSMIAMAGGARIRSEPDAERPISATQPASPALELTDAEIDRIEVAHHKVYGEDYINARQFARAILAADRALREQGR